MLFLSDEKGSIPYNAALFGYILAVIIGLVSIYRVWRLKS